MKASEANKKKFDEKGMHDGHRARLLDLAYNASLDNLSKFQVMEFFLTYVFPRGDVNPLAHRLLDRFETFTNAIEADVEDLKQVPGINERSAKRIHMFSEMFYYFVESKMGRRCKVSNLSEIMDIAEDHLRFRNTEHMLLLALSPTNVITHKRRISMNKDDEVGISVMEFTSFLTSSKASTVVIAHGHPYGLAKPSPEDERAFKRVDEICKSFGVNLLESLIVGENGVFGQREDGLLRKYMDVEEINNVLTTFSNK